MGTPYLPPLPPPPRPLGLVQTLSYISLPLPLDRLSHRKNFRSQRLRWLCAQWSQMHLICAGRTRLAPNPNCAGGLRNVSFSQLVEKRGALAYVAWGNCI